MSVSYAFDKVAPLDFPALLSRFTGKSLRSPFRSTVPLLSLIEHCPTDWRGLLQSWGVPENVTVHLEYGVASPKPRANPSQTDALLIAKHAPTVWAVEAKWTEPRYETVAQRISRPEGDGADPCATVGVWLDYLRPYAEQSLDLMEFSEVVYQVMHRAASACAVAAAYGRRPELVYLHFHPSPDSRSADTAQYVADLNQLRARLGNAAGFPFRVVEMPLSYTARFEAIQGLDKRDPASAHKVKAALAEGPLFIFETPTITLI